MVWGFLLNAASILIPVAMELKSLTDTGACTEYNNVQISVGSSDSKMHGSNHDDKNSGGNVPHIATWDELGGRIGQFHPKRSDKINAGVTKNFQVCHNKLNGDVDEDVNYIMLSNLESDAICISTITVGNTGNSVTFYGDTGYKCGQSWFPSQAEISGGYKPRCVWLDSDGSNNINARAMSFHLSDLDANEAKMKEYQEHPEALCQSTPRFSFWGNLLPDGIPPFFIPRLKYRMSTEENGMRREGADWDISRVVDKPGQYDKSVQMQQGEQKTKRGPLPEPRTSKRNGANHNPEHLIVTNDRRDDVREVCEHPNSYGWDIASSVQNLYCDMEHKQLYRLCSPEQDDNCFDIQNKTIIPKGGIMARDEHAAFIPRKAYTSIDLWGEQS